MHLNLCLANIDETLKEYKEENLRIEDKWILNKLDKLVVDVTNHIEKYEIGIAATKIYDFIWSEFCDWYIEIVKPRLYSKEDEAKKEVMYTLNHVLVCSLKLLASIYAIYNREDI